MNAPAKLQAFFDYLGTAPEKPKTQELAKILHSEIIWTFPKGAGPIVGGTHRGIIEISELLSRIFTEFYDRTQFRFELHEMFGNEVNSVARYSVIAVTAYNQPYNNDYALICELRDGLIVRLEEYFDTAIAAKQMFPE